MTDEHLISQDQGSQPTSTVSLPIVKLLIGSASLTIAAACYFFTESILFSFLAWCGALAAGFSLLASSSTEAHHQPPQPKDSCASEPATALPPFSPSVASTQATLASPVEVLEMDRQERHDGVTLPASLSIDFNLRTTVEETVSRFSVVAQERGFELSCLFSSDSPTPFRGDPGDLRLILINVIDYVISVSSYTEVVVYALLQQQTATHATFRFSVSGLSHTALGAMTKSTFNHALTSTGPSHAESTIAISKQMVKAWGGQLEIENRPGHDTMIWFTVTLEKQPPKVFSDLPPRSTLTGIRLLLVGNSVSLSDEEATAWQLTYHRAPRAALALSMLNTAVQEGRPYDVVIFDCHELDAEVLTLATRLRQSNTLATVRLVFFTTHGKKGDAQHVRQAGFDAYLTHPLSSGLLFDCLATILSQPPQTHPTPHPIVTRYTLAEARTRGRARILVADSNLLDQKHLVRIVEELGYRADIAVTAREAIEAYARLPYAAVLVPYQMPGIDGIAAAQHIRQQDTREGTHTPLIGILQSDRSHESAQCLAADMDAILMKPLRSTDLKTALDRACQLSAKQTTAQAGALQQTDENVEVDLHTALARVDGDKELFDEMTLLLNEEYPKALRKMAEAISRQDSQALAYSANTLRGALGNFAALKAIAATTRLELMGRSGDLSQAQSVFTDLEKHLARLQALLADFRIQAAA